MAKEDFVRRMKAALTPSQPAAPQPQPAASAAPPSQANDPPSSSSEQVASSSSSNDDRVQALLAERAAKLAEKKKLEEEEAKRQRAEKAKAKAEAEASGSKKTDEQSKHMEALRKKQREEREERQRILKAIEDDKAARRARRAAAEAERRAAAASEKPESAPFAPASQVYPSTGRLSEHCALQVRLFDGSTIRSRFSSDETLKDVRRWVDETRGDGREPYTFKVLLTPLPSRKIDVAEEDRSLRSLDLTPSATLILVRVPRYTAAHAAAGAPVAQAQGGGVFQRLVAFVLAIINGSFGTIAALFSSFFSTSGPATLTTTEPAASSQTTQRQAGAASARRRGGRIAGLDHADERRNDQQFYNGNSVSHVESSSICYLSCTRERLTVPSLRPISSLGRMTGSDYGCHYGGCGVCLI